MDEGVGGRELGHLGPAGRGDLPAADVDGDDDPRAVGGDDLVEEVDVAQRRRADDHPLGAGAERVADGADGPQPAAVLDRDPGPGGDPPEVVERRRRAGAGAVEVDDVQVARARLDPRPRGLQRIVVVDGLRVEVAVREPHGAPAADVDRGVEDHAATWAPANVRSSASPSSEDFSGWNCTPATLPRSTIDAKRSPYSPVPATSSGSAGRQAKVCTW